MIFTCLCEFKIILNTYIYINMMYSYISHLPSWPSIKLIASPFSRRQVIVGVGEPVAAHLSVTLFASVTTISVLVGKSRISGGTNQIRKIRVGFFFVLRTCVWLFRVIWCSAFKVVIKCKVLPWVVVFEKHMAYISYLVCGI